MRDAYILGAVRTPIGKRDGGLSGMRPDELAADCLAELVRRTGVDPGLVEDVVMGCVTQIGEQGFNIARVAALAAGFPVTVAGTTVNRMCGSSQQAVHFAAQSVMSGAMDLAIGAGVESMSRVAMGSDGGRLSERLLDRFDLVNQGISAEFIAERWDLPREALDAFGLESHRRAVAAADGGRFDREVFAVGTNGKKVALDEGPRRGTSPEKMASLKSAFKEGGRITAGNSSQISDGAAAVLVGSREAAARLGLVPRARFVSFAVAGVDPTMMLTGPIPATRKALERAGLGVKDVDLFEVNEAFASVVLAWAKETGADLDRTNVNGGAIALGHPLGASGARLVTTLLHEMERRQVRYGLVTMCIGFGQGTATLLERVA